MYMVLMVLLGTVLVNIIFFSCLQQRSTRYFLISHKGNADSSVFKDVALGSHLVPRVISTADILYITSVTFIADQLLMLAMDVNPNPGLVTADVTNAYLSLSTTVKQKLNKFKRIANQVTRHEHHLNTYQFYIQAGIASKGLKPKLRPALKPLHDDFYKQ